VCGQCPLATQAVPITLGGPLPTTRTATLGSATAGFTGSGNATVTDINAGFAGMAPWTERGSAAGADNSSGVLVAGQLTVNVTSGAWGSKMASGTWTINNSSFWTSYADAAISLHVGNGRNVDEPDHFAWLIEQGQTSGTWSYDGGSLRGGGLSNLKLYSSGTGSNVPDGGSSLALIGLAVASLGFLRRKLS